MYSLCGQDLFNDLEIFHSYNHEKNDTVIHFFEKNAYNKGCMQYIINKIQKPLHDINELKNLQNDIINLEKVYNNNNEIVDKHINIVKNNENCIEWMNSYTEDDLFSVFDTVYFKFFAFTKIGCNSSSSLLTCNNLYNIAISPLIGVMSPIIYFLIPYVVLVFRMKIKMSFITYIKTLYSSIVSFPIRNTSFLSIQCISYIFSLFLYFQGLFNSYELSKNSFKICSYIVSKMNGVINYVNSCKELLEIFERPSKINIKPIISVNTESYDFGKQLVLFKNINIDSLNNIYNESNLLLSLLTIMKVRINKNMCFTEFIEKDTTYLYMENSSHLLIDNPVTNTITLNSENCVITGPNAAGKSTFIKSTSLNILLSQTMGISCSSVCKITPFYYINTQINIPDSKGVESLFEAEMFRCKYNIDIVKELPTNYKSFIVFDEIFSSTNIIEGISGAYAILDKLSKYKNTLIIITTHYLYLTKLPNFKKIKFIADIIDSDSQQSDIIDSQQSDIIDSQQSDIIDSQQNNIITYNYKIQNGISKQFIALDILKSKFLDDLDIIEKAMSIKNKLLV